MGSIEAIMEKGIMDIKNVIIINAIMAMDINDLIMANVIISIGTDMLILGNMETLLKLAHGS